jgi:hypothetical protein
LFTNAGFPSEPFRLLASDVDSTDLLFVILGPSMYDSLSKGVSQYCTNPAPAPSTVCLGLILPADGLDYCTGEARCHPDCVLVVN